jgi:transcriptional regulator with XRE-family HTH domain
MGIQRTPARVKRGKAMLRIRNKLGYSLASVEYLTGVKELTIIRLERGDVGGRLEVVLKLAKLYEVTASELIGETRPQPVEVPPPETTHPTPTNVRH